MVSLKKPIKSIKINNLSVGDCYTYNKLCKILNLESVSGNQKKSQLEELKRYFDYNKDGTKFIITEIYDKPLDKEYKYPANALYIKYIECILMQYLAEQKGNEAYIVSQKLWLQLGMINNKFIELQGRNNDLLSMDENMDNICIYDFYKRCRTRFYDIVKKSLDSLQKRYLIKYDDNQYMIKKENCFNYDIASTEEVEKILVIERETLLEFDLENKQQIFLKNLNKQFYEVVNLKCKELYGWDGIYKCYHIIYNQQNLITALPDDELKLQKLMLNDSIINTMNTQASKLYEKHGLLSDSNYDIFLLDENADSVDSNKFYYKDNYLEMQQLLSEELLRINKKE